MTSRIGTDCWAALAMCAAVGLAPDCLAQFAATERPPEQRDAQLKPVDPPPTKQRSSIEAPVTPERPVPMTENPLNSDRGQFDSLPKPVSDPGAADGAAVLNNAADRGTSGRDRKHGAAGGAGSSGLGGAARDGASAAGVERGYDRAAAVPDNGNGGSTGGVGLNSAGDGNLGASTGLLNSVAGLGANNNGGSGGNSAQGGANSGSTGIDGALNSFGGASGGRSENANGNGNRRSSGGPAENGNAGGGRDSGGSARNLPARGNSAGSGSDRSVGRNQNEAPANNSGREAPNSQKDKSGADGEDRSARNDSNSNDNGGSDRSNRDAPPEGNSDGAAKAGAPDRPEEEGWSASSDPVGRAAARRRFGDLSAGAAGRDLLGEKRDAEAVDAQDALHRIGDRVDPRTGAVGIKAPVAGGVSPLLRAVVETAKKRKQKK
ncbi:hypothetical protein MNQ96_16945 [Sphingopyxis granuli]|uniref:hypothetical protein n=1 Tax=Sphingopyxis granuli TaxID=267128 RepID=UPI001F53729D|nr:hypothetical protein [Sphingopyxis granuli]UNK79206.1 hypothetical protein MNQ96_16945 [Sphingopyxis granuli]